uniref:Ribokinase n=1 Tax=Riptortus pedestris TaxID=329032 RepID=R4WIW3_RIPPE|nr:ribokinase [Riptortus pedestris]
MFYSEKMSINKVPEIVVFGSCMVDLVCYAPRLPRPGETIHGSDFKMGNGGKGANQCVAAAKLGASTCLIARVGKDSFGANYKADLHSLGVNTDHVIITENISTGMAQITVSDTGENVIVIVPGANNKLSFEDAQNAQNFLLNSRVVIFQFETPLKSTIEVLQFVKREGSPCTIVNGAPAIKSVDLKIYELCDIFCVNESEAAEFTGLNVSSVSDAFLALKKLQSYGCKTVIITLGKDGAVFSEDGNDPQHISSPSVSAVDTTGAGDAFIGALAYFTARFPNSSLGSRISRACKVASHSVLFKGTQSSFPNKNDLSDEFFSDIK